jgi:hypothetical protein
VPRAARHRFSPLPQGSGCFRFRVSVFVSTKEEKEQR